MDNKIYITLLRHGRSRADDEQVHEGRYDSPLTETGRTQARARAQLFIERNFRFDKIISSTLIRAHQTAEVIGQVLNVPIETDPDWMEFNNGPLAGLPFAVAEERFPRPSFRNPYQPFHGTGESDWEAHRRGSQAIENAALAGEAPRLKQTMQAAGFNDEAFTLTDAVFRQWAAWAGRQPPIWPDNESSRWIFRRAAHRGDGQLLAMGMVQPSAGRDDDIAARVETSGTWLVSWNRLGAELKHVIPREFAHVILGLAGAVLLILAIAFRSARAVGLFAVTTALVLACLAGAMSLFGMSWNFFDLAAVLLLLGTGTDYSILLLLALKRNGGDAPAAQRELGLVICLCASSAAAGFGTISWANNLGLASLGQTCALGLLIDALISLFLLPHGWALLHRSQKQ